MQQQLVLIANSYHDIQKEKKKERKGDEIVNVAMTWKDMILLLVFCLFQEEGVFQSTAMVNRQMMKLIMLICCAEQAKDGIDHVDLLCHVSPYWPSFLP